MNNDDTFWTDWSRDVGSTDAREYRLRYKINNFIEVEWYGRSETCPMLDLLEVEYR